MSSQEDFRSVYDPPPFVKQIYEVQSNRLLNWRNRYETKEYPYKVALNTVYQLLTCERMWDRMIGFFDGTARYADFQTAYSTMQALSGSEATRFIHGTLESEFRRIDRISILDMNEVRQLVNKAGQSSDYNAKMELERIYLYYTGAVELIYGWVALGLTGMDIQHSVVQLTGILIGGNYTEMDTAILNFGSIIDCCYKPLDEELF